MNPQSCFFIRISKKYIRIRFRDILYIESVGNYVKIVTDTGSFLTPLTVKQLERALPPDLFCRINRGSIVAMDRIVCFDRDSILLDNHVKIIFSERYRKELEARITILTGG